MPAFNKRFERFELAGFSAEAMIYTLVFAVCVVLTFFFPFWLFQAFFGLISIAIGFYLWLIIKLGDRKQFQSAMLRSFGMRLSPILIKLVKPD